MILRYISLGHSCPQIFDLDQISADKINMRLKGASYVMAVDPSSSSTGIIMGDLKTKKPERIIAIQRNKKQKEDAITYRQRQYELVEMWVKTNAHKIRAMKVEQPFKHPKQSKDSYDIQMAIFRSFVNIAKRFDIECIIIAPQTWKSVFLGPYKISMGLNLAKANKKEIHEIAERFFNEFKKMPDDCTDAYGIFQHYLAVDYSEENDKLRVGDGHREYNHNIRLTVSSLEDIRGYIDLYLSRIHTKYPDAVECEFEYNPKYSLEDNIRNFTSTNTRKRQNLFYAQIMPTIKNLRYIIPYRDTVGRINKNMPLYVIGYRIN